MAHVHTHTRTRTHRLQQWSWREGRGCRSEWYGGTGNGWLGPESIQDGVLVLGLTNNRVIIQPEK